MRRREFLQKRLKEGTILDIGNIQYEGVTHKWLMSVFPNSVFYGLDLTDQSKLGLSFTNQYIGSGAKMSFEDGLFDTVYAGQVLEHVWNPKEVTDECYRVLKPGGVLILDLPHVYSLSRMFRYTILGEDIIHGNPDHKLFLSKAMLDNLCKKSGFTGVEIRTDDSFSFKSRLYTLPQIWPFRHLGETVMVCAQK
jgi:SAM-dependent methyltransferase